MATRLRILGAYTFFQLACILLLSPHALADEPNFIDSTPKSDDVHVVTYSSNVSPEIAPPIELVNLVLKAKANLMAEIDAHGEDYCLDQIRREHIRYFGRPDDLASVKPTLFNGIIVYKASVSKAKFNSKYDIDYYFHDQESTNKIGPVQRRVIAKVRTKNLKDIFAVETIGLNDLDPNAPVSIRNVEKYALDELSRFGFTMESIRGAIEPQPRDDITSNVFCGLLAAGATLCFNEAVFGEAKMPTVVLKIAFSVFFMFWDRTYQNLVDLPKSQVAKFFVESIVGYAFQILTIGLLKRERFAQLDPFVAGGILNLGIVYADVALFKFASNSFKQIIDIKEDTFKDWVGQNEFAINKKVSFMGYQQNIRITKPYINRTAISILMIPVKLGAAAVVANDPSNITNILVAKAAIIGLGFTGYIANYVWLKFFRHPDTQRRLNAEMLKGEIAKVRHLREELKNVETERDKAARAILIMGHDWNADPKERNWFVNLMASIGSKYVRACEWMLQTKAKNFPNTAL